MIGRLCAKSVFLCFYDFFTNTQHPISMFRMGSITLESNSSKNLGNNCEEFQLTVKANLSTLSGPELKNIPPDSFVR